MIRLADNIRACLAACLLLALAPAGAQPPPPDVAEQAAKIADLSFLAGDWEGSGWTFTGPGARAEFNQTETIRPMLGGKILTIHGQGRATDAEKGAAPEFEAFAIVSWDDASDAYNFRSYSGGRSGDFEAALDGEGVFVWRFPATEFRITVAGDTWVETGHRTLPDGRVVQFFEMTLTRK